VQVKLLRVLETRQFRPLGTTVNKTVDVRIIAATNRNLREEIQKGTFREDLFHRLSRIEIHLPPLRNRPEDIPLLIRAFLEEYSEKIGKRAKGLSRQAQKALQTHSWRGNIRELKNAVEGALLMCQKDFIDLCDLPKTLQSKSSVEAPPASADEGRILTLEEAEREHIVHVLTLTQHNLRRAAALLDISRSTLYQKLKRYDIQIR
jgi:transcriptional regulator with PAS, ATPase and Fis domain